MDDMLLRVENLKIGFATRPGNNVAVDGVAFTIHKGETFALLGESGCGKSLTSLAIMQLLPPAATILDGKIILEQQNLLALPEVAMRKVRGKRIAMIFQEPMTSLNPVLTVGEQITEALSTHLGLRGKTAKERVLDLLNAVGLPSPTKHYHDYPHQLSGGMKQRVMIAMALALDPDLLIADEPTSALDVTIQAQILNLLQRLQQQTGMAILMITHDLGVVNEVADHVAVMYAGHLVEEAPRKQFFSQPQHPYSQKLFASLPNIQKRERPLVVIPGVVPSLTQTFTGCRFASRCDYAWQACYETTPQWLSTLEAKEKHFARCHLLDPRYSSRHILKLKQPTEAAINLQKPTKETKQPILKVEDLKIHFPIQKGLFKRTVGWVKAVDGVSLQLTEGKTVAIVGESGCGKTTFARGILQLIQPTAGTVILQNCKLDKLTRQSLKQLRKNAQIIFQDPFSSMNPRMLVRDIIAEGMLALGIGNENEREQRIDKLIEQVGLPLDCKQRYPHEFSGGQRQRICIARALAVEPKLIICDEPTSALDVSVQAQILNLLKQLQLEKALSYLFITHNIAVVAYLADEVAVMTEGKIVEHGTVKQILTQPQHPYTQKLLSAVPVVH